MAWKLWTRERLTVTDLQDNLQDQTVLHYASAAAADAAIPSVNRKLGMLRWLDDVRRGEWYDLAAGAWKWAYGDPLAPTVTAWPGGSGWAAVTGYARPGYFRTSSGLVHGSGAVVTAGGAANGAVVATLPPGFRPNALLPLQIPASTASGDCRLDLATTGNLTAVGAIGAGVVLFLDGLSYNPNTLAVA